MWTWFMCLTEWGHGNNVLAVQFVYVPKICAKEPLRNYVIVFLDVPNGIGLNLFCYLWIKLLRLIWAWKFQKILRFAVFMLLKYYYFSHLIIVPWPFRGSQYILLIFQESETKEELVEINYDDFQLEDFLHPGSSSIRRLIEHKVLKNPNVLNEMLSVKFSELLRLFKKLLINKKGSIEGAYLELFQVNCNVH